MSKQKKTKLSRKTIMVRAMALFLCALMVLSVLAILLPFLGVNSYAAGYDPAQKVEVGLMYGTGVTVGFEVKAEYGFDVGYIGENNEYLSLYQVTDTVVSVTCDANMTNTSRTFAKTGSNYPDVGGWHLEFTYASALPLSQLIDETKTAVAAYGINNVFPAFINDGYRIRIGQFSSKSEANQMLSKLNGTIAGLSIAAPSTTAVSVINPYTNIILFEFDSRRTGKELGLEAIQPPVGQTYMVTPAKNSYEGIFKFARWSSGSTDGVALTNVLTIEQYVECVLPWEIGNEWPAEAQKAFAVTARTFVLSMLGRHESAYGFDMCNGTHCQAFYGTGRTNEAVRQAVAETAGTILVYNGEPATTYYSAVAGGITASAAEVWGESAGRPYLTAVPTPWENYASHKKGDWRSEVSPKELCTYLNGKGYTTLRGSVSSIKVNSYAKNSSYIYSLTITDSYGTSVTIKTCDKIRIALAAYVNSANFVVGKAGTTAEMMSYNLATPVPIIAPVDISQDSPGVTVLTGDGKSVVSLYDSVRVMTKAGPENVTELADLNVVTREKGYISYDMTVEAGTPTEKETLSYIPAELADLSDILSYRVVTTSETITLDGASGNFVFVGRGWGHGVGMSQWGTKNMAELGYSFEEILSAYFPGTNITPMQLVEQK